MCGHDSVPRPCPTTQTNAIPPVLCNQGDTGAQEFFVLAEGLCDVLVASPAVGGGGSKPKKVLTCRPGRCAGGTDASRRKDGEKGGGRGKKPSSFVAGGLGRDGGGYQVGEGVRRGWGVASEGGGPRDAYISHGPLYTVQLWLFCNTPSLFEICSPP